jgi:hypothetical protein
MMSCNLPYTVKYPDFERVKILPPLVPIPLTGSFSGNYLATGYDNGLFKATRRELVTFLGEFYTCI